MDRSAYLAKVRALDKEKATELVEDLHFLQWSVLNEDSFKAVFELYEAKHKYLVCQLAYEMTSFLLTKFKLRGPSNFFIGND